MNWFNKLKSGIRTIVRRSGIPEDLWVKCERCHVTLYKKQIEQSAGTCSNCGNHFRVSSLEYLNVLVDPDSFQELFTNVHSTDSLKFEDRMKYSDRIKEYTKRTGMTAAVRTGLATLDGVPVGIGVHEFGFAGGSLGSAEGERICRLIDRCLEDRRPLILVCRAGGARMQESALSLMQLAKINARLARFAEHKMLFFSILADPTTAGVSASYALIGDINIAEPNALIGFTGERITSSSVSEQEQEALRQAQRAEKVLEHGFIDLIVHRKDMRAELSRLLRLLWDAPEATADPRLPQVRAEMALRRLKAYVTLFLFRRGKVLLIERSQRKTFAPGMWTGVGGSVSPRELDDLAQAVFRETAEETGVQAHELEGLVLRAVDTRMEGVDLATIFFYRANLNRDAPGLDGRETEEGVLRWVDPEAAAALDMIPNAHRALDLMLSGEEGEVTFLR